MRIIVAIFSFCLLFSVFGAEKKGAVSGTGKVSDDYKKENGKISLVGKKDAAETNADSHVPTAMDVMRGMTDDTIFLKIGDDDILTWGAVREQADLLLKVKADALLSSAGAAGNATRLSLYASGVSRIVRQYLLVSVIAHDAKSKGLVVENETIAKEIEGIRSDGTPLNTFQYQYATNMVYMRSYVNKLLRPQVSVSAQAVEELIKRRHESNLSVPATNRLLRATLEDVRSRLLKNEISFSDAVDEYSECSTCSADDGDCGTWEEDEEHIAPSLKAVCFSIPTNTLSEVVDTPEAFHLVKITGRYVPTAKARAEDGEVSSVDVKHIQIDKWQLDPEYTSETAREHLENLVLKRRLKARQLELLKTTPIESAIPLESKRGRGPIRFR